MTKEKRVEKLRHFITCLKCEVSGKCCDNNCPTQYNAGNMGEIIENLEEIAKALEQEPKTGHWIYVGEENKEETKAGNFRYVCSECGFSDVHGKSICVPYCWQCGAKMAESEENEE